MNTSVQLCSKLILDAKRIAVLTGAGVSTAAGIPDFRGPKGLYVTRQYDPDTIFDINFFYRNPQPFFDFARDFVNLSNTIRPTKTHQFLSQLEKSRKLKGIVTQNIDSLHQMAGSKNVYEMHGSFWKNFCLNCDKEFPYKDFWDKLSQEKIPHCSCGGVIKPDIVFFGENVKYFDKSVALAKEADLLFVIGTSCVVYPAASIPDYCDGKVIVANMTPVSLNHPNIVLSIEHDLDSFFESVGKEIFSNQLENK